MAGKEGFKYIQETLLHKYPFDVFIFSNNQESFTEIKRTYGTVASKIVLQKPLDWEGRINKEIGGLSDYVPKEGFRTISNSLNFYYSRSESIKLALEQASDRQLEYQWVLSARFDLGQIDKFNGYQPFKVSQVGFNPKLDREYLYSALWNQTNAGLADQWFFGSQKVMEIFTLMPEEALDYFKDGSKYLDMLSAGIPFSNMNNPFSNEICHLSRQPKPAPVILEKSEAIDNHLIHKFFLMDKYKIERLRMTALVPGVARVLYTHTDYADCWPIYFGQVEKLGNFFTNNYVFVNQPDDRIPSYFNQIYYEDSQSYTDRLSTCLQKITDQVVFFEHEDMILYDVPELTQLINYSRMIKRRKIHDIHPNRFDAIKLIRGGKFLSRKVLNPGVKQLRAISRISQWIFSIQPSFWSRSALISLLEKHKGVGIWEFEAAAQKSMRKARFRVATVFENTIKRGDHHYDSKIYPYIATGIVKGKWNTLEYQREIVELSTEYSVDLSERGTNS